MCKYRGPKVWTHSFIQTQFLQFVWISSNKIHSKKKIKKKIFHTRENTPIKVLKYTPGPINSNKSDSSRAFQQHQEHPQIPIQSFQFRFYLLIFNEKKWFNNR